MLDNPLHERLKSRTEEYFKLSHHDKYHSERVYNLALQIARDEKADLKVVGAAALLHDVARALEDQDKIEDHATEGARMAQEILEEENFPQEKIPSVVHCIEVHRYSKGMEARSLEAKILQDADRLDLLGAIGIARVFTRGGWGNKPIHDPETPPKEKYDGDSMTSVNHIYEKVLKVKDTMNTKTAKVIAEERQGFTELFLERLLKEWKAEI
ncbi:HD domain-containing protein [Candidatus Bathyarchaeota archaeon]|nr:HD domain-containing protein [Candidatus Bathyarchaeota archaeon]NIU81153.1 HD domain-containing protein [Candidatus Bathyarchaeota archaeon]NIV67779.1 HD domain-containing protein [Candidatus Bathyarchaeota archaeon]NIW16273.1 HD domain-containing protein [Candidatus Bathyarchaeota archaeon]NIW34391.1 HD domain-containing protein [Candidatus Bathyarchaeota archaeon]